MAENEAAPADHWSALMAAAQCGDRDCYSRLLREIIPWLHRCAARSLWRPDEAEDAVQDILLTLHQYRASYDPARPFRPWLLGIARYRIAERVRVRGRRARREVALGPEHDAVPVEANAETVFPAIWERRALGRALNTLSDGQRAAIEMLKLREMSLKEAAAASGMSVAALKVAVHRGTSRLRQVMEAETRIAA